MLISVLHLDQSMLNKRTGLFYLSLKHETQLVLNNFEKRLSSVLHLLVLYICLFMISFAVVFGLPVVAPLEGRRKR